MLVAVAAFPASSAELPGPLCWIVGQRYQGPPAHTDPFVWRDASPATESLVQEMGIVVSPVKASYSLTVVAQSFSLPPSHPTHWRQHCHCFSADLDKHQCIQNKSPVNSLKAGDDLIFLSNTCSPVGAEGTAPGAIPAGPWLRTFSSL